METVEMEHMVQFLQRMVLTEQILLEWDSSLKEKGKEEMQE